MKSRPLDILSTMLLIAALGGIFYFIIPKQSTSIVTIHPGADTVGTIDTLAIVNGDTVFTRSDTIIDK